MLDPELSPESESQQIPDKLYFRIGEVSRLAGIKPHVLRFWETEFPRIGPKKSGTGQRLYRRKDVELVLEIKGLLYDKRFTIEGARKFLEDRARKEEKSAEQPAYKATRSQAKLFEEPIPGLDAIKTELRSILDLLK
jgi:DNA-binding transcriptional MerR regulator